MNFALHHLATLIRVVSDLRPYADILRVFPLASSRFAAFPQKRYSRETARSGC